MRQAAVLAAASTAQRGVMNGSSLSQTWGDTSNGTTSLPSSESHSNGAIVSGTLSRAEKFEDEKKRIIESCFTKADDDGAGMSEIHSGVESALFVRRL